ncbi:DUF6233 domain-containing protein [Streptomyces sp. NPDC055817]
MSEALPRIRVVLPDGQNVVGRLHARQQTRLGWRYWVGLPAGQNIGDQGEIEAGEYRVWLSAQEAKPIEGESYDDVVTRPLSSAAAPPSRWAFVVQQLTNGRGRTVGTMVHEYECEDSPRGPNDLDVMQALDALARPGARACTKCDAAKVLLPALGKVASITSCDSVC